MVGKLRHSLSHFFGDNKEWLITWTVVLIAILLVVHFWPGPPSPVPATIKRQAQFSIIYPESYTIAASSWKFLSDGQSIQFSVKKDNITTVFTEQPTPLAYQDDAAAYNRFIGTLRPSANFNVPLGSVSITNFVTQGDYQIVGKTGILNTHGTLLLAHPDTDLVDAQWRDLFESLRVD